MGSKGQLDVICSALAFVGLVGCGGATADAGTDADSSATTAATRDVTDTQSSGSETGDDTDASAGACGPPPAVTGEAALSEVTFPNARGELITAVLQVPEGAEGRPAVIVLHGSGGLFQEPDEDEVAMGLAHGDMERQFREWSALLAAEGYVALFPASFFSRGFFDYNDDVDNIPPGFDDEERLRARVYDAHAAVEYLCSLPAVCCEGLGLVGFSNGGSTTVLALHEAVETLDGLDALPPLAARPPLSLGVAYYPGCGLDGLLTLSDDLEDLADFYFPHAPLYIQHAEEDDLLEHCPTRVLQASAVAEERGVKNPVDLLVYPGVDHGFDSNPANADEEAARDEARARALDLLRAALW